MRKRVLIVAAACILLSGVIVYVSVFIGKKPYRDLDASEILSAAVRVEPPGKTLPIADTKKLTEYLRDVVIYNRDDSYKTYDGLSITYTLTMTDGMQTEIMPYNPCIVIDGVGYRTERESSDALISYANQLFDKGIF